MGFSFAKHPYVGYTSGNYTNDAMEKSSSQMEMDHEVIASQYTEMIDNQIKIVKSLRTKL